MQEAINITHTQISRSTRVNTLLVKQVARKMSKMDKYKNRALAVGREVLNVRSLRFRLKITPRSLMMVNPEFQRMNKSR